MAAQHLSRDLVRPSSGLKTWLKRSLTKDTLALGLFFSVTDKFLMTKKLSQFGPMSEEAD